MRKKSPSGLKTAKKPRRRKAKRAESGKFLPGTKAGPGRPKGLRNKTTMMIEELLEGEAENLTRALIARAKKGYAIPLQIVFDRIAPARRDRHIEFDLPAIASPQDLVAAHSAIISQVAGGTLTPTEATSLANLLDLKRRAIETHELEARLAALESRLTPKGLSA